MRRVGIWLRDWARWFYISFCACWQMYWRYSGFGLVLSSACCGGPSTRTGGALGGGSPGAAEGGAFVLAPSFTAYSPETLGLGSFLSRDRLFGRRGCLS
jgi:hypothetical protein